MIIINDDFYSDINDVSSDILNSLINNSVYKFDFRIENNKVLFLEESFFEMMSHLRRLRLNIPMYFNIEYFILNFQKLINDSSNKSFLIKLVFAVKKSPLIDNYESDLITLFSINNIESILVVNNDLKISVFNDFKINSNEFSSFLSNNKLIRIAKLDAIENNYHDNLILNYKNQVIRSAFGNILIYKNRTITTPSISDGAPSNFLMIPFINYLKKNNFECVERCFSIFDLQIAEDIATISVTEGLSNVVKYKNKQFNKTIFIELFTSFVKDEILK
ncbi:MAG: hypothetical protein CMC67_03575 [Flavobacteriaceae bacterium]|nr:hypothetical protein [Flavobacteriaceae bacterium]